MFNKLIKDLDAQIEAQIETVMLQKEVLKDLMLKKRNIIKLQEQARVLGIEDDGQTELEVRDEQLAVVV